jgi:hypothetical protein
MPNFAIQFQQRRHEQILLGATQEMRNGQQRLQPLAGHQVKQRPPPNGGTWLGLQSQAVASAPMECKLRRA